MKNTRKFIALASLILLASLSFGQTQQIPDPPVPPRLVVDYTGTLTSQQSGYLERKLVAFNDTTSTQILVVITPTLNGLTKEEFADRLAEKWGVGQKGKNNGIVVLVKPKTSSEKGEVRISVGYGLEGAVTDAITKAAIYGFTLSFNLFNFVYFMTGGGSARSTEILVTFAFDLIRNLRLYGVAAAFAVIVFFVALTLFLITNRITRATESYAEA